MTQSKAVFGCALLALVLAACGDNDMSMMTGAPPTMQPPPPAVVDPDDPNREQYDAPGTNPFVVAAHDPLSTFATDVDTASYDIFRRDINRGVLPQKESVRLEEYVNAFGYEYPAPSLDAPHPFSITLRAAKSPLPSAQTTLMAVAIKAKEIPWGKRPANLVFLVDVSGSMSADNKLPLVKEVLRQALEVLDGEDTLSIVTYSGSTAVRLAPTPVSDRARILSVINSLGAGGSTAGGAGIELAYQQAEKGFITGGINHVLLCTDGDFNVGISDTDALVALIEEKRETGITLTALGFGFGNLNDAMMEAVTNAGNGIYSVISDKDQAIQYAHEKLLRTFNLVAKDVKIQVELNPDKVYAYRLLGYENRALQDDQFRDDKVDAGEVGSGHTVTAIYELALNPSELPQGAGTPQPVDGVASDHQSLVPASELCRVRIRYKGPNATSDDAAQEIEAGLAESTILPDVASASADLRWAIAVAALAEILKESPYADRTALPTIESLLKASAGTAADRLELLDLFAKAKPLL